MLESSVILNQVSSLVPGRVKAVMRVYCFHGQPPSEAERFSRKHQGLGAQLDSNHRLVTYLGVLPSHLEPYFLPYETRLSFVSSVV